MSGYFLWVAIAIPVAFLLAAGVSMFLAHRLGRWPRR